VTVPRLDQQPDAQPPVPAPAFMHSEISTLPAQEGFEARHSFGCRRHRTQQPKQRTTRGGSSPVARPSEHVGAVRVLAESSDKLIGWGWWRGAPAPRRGRQRKAAGERVAQCHRAPEAGARRTSMVWSRVPRWTRRQMLTGAVVVHVGGKACCQSPRYTSTKSELYF